MASLFFQKTRGNNINFISIIVKGKEKVEEQRVKAKILNFCSVLILVCVLVYWTD